ncbi:MAG: radical SAM family heme chaperone HemW [Candidatus Poribacteria bacterium]|nr:radical SAM family heme chaperone HemW [Candidatus Poribacteria bacterium]
MNLSIALYIHIPFCATKCYYCDFNTYAFRKDQVEAYIDALAVEMDLYASGCPPLRTIFFGGGTPSILSAQSLDRLFTDLHAHFRMCPDAEFTVECNPGTVDRDKLQVMRAAGVNRLSFGVQAMDNATLCQIGRIHKVSEVIRSYELAREAGFGNINLDLIFALPDQTVGQWKHSLQKIVALHPEHISTYNLTLEEGTAFYEWWESGKLRLASDELEAEMYEMAIDMLTDAGYVHYEISNFARPNHFAEHNLVYWNNEPYIGLGAGACGYVDGLRYTNIRGIPDYINCLRRRQKPIMSSERLAGRAEKAETIILGLWKRKGVCHESYQRRFGEPIAAEFGAPLEKWIGFQMLEWRDDDLRLTDQGLMLANEVFMDFLPI